MITLKYNSKEFAVVIPAYNEADSIVDVVSSVSTFAKPLVIDDGSIDNTVQLAKNAGAIVVELEYNHGYDAALDVGLKSALKFGFKYAITMDADGQHFSSTIEYFMKELSEGADLVVGMRDKHQRLGEQLFAFFGKLLWSIKDPLCGMKGYRLELISRAGELCSYQSIGTELLIRAVRSGCRISQLPISTRERCGVSRFGSGLQANMKILKSFCTGLLTAKPLPQ